MEYLYIALGLAALVGLYMWSYSLNEKCEKPEGTIEADCAACNSRACKDRKNEIKQ